MKLYVDCSKVEGFQQMIIDVEGYMKIDDVITLISV